MARFHPLRVAAVDRLTDDSVTLTFDVPPPLREEYRFTPGQHLAIRRFADGTEIRRTYSICCAAPPVDAPEEPRFLRVGVRLVEDGAFSTYAFKEVSVGDELDVMTPAGRFTLDPAPGRYAAIVGGSGITPVLSIVTTLLEREPKADFCLIRSDRTAASTMFLEEVADLKDRWPDRFQLVTVLSREEQQAGLGSGRLDEERLSQLLPALLPVSEIEGWFLCGPFGLVQGAGRTLRALGVPRRRVHEEIFHVDDGGAVAVASAPSTPAPAHSTVTATLDGRSGTWPVQPGETLLETVLRNRADAPYACKGGVCGTCRAFCVSGEVRMDRNFALEPEETEAGYVLACQSRPATDTVELDFDR
ncbi:MULTISPECIES: 2Fe-2S iron-sulfur cluster-binding protein [Streptomyces]|uniref:Phenylacetic acid degradation protein n=1 Tax=Streptomyces venezuelae TaxID=54571 RepID=A0A5P2BE72_STRVZ|nr:MULTISPECIES: 2Fe-2S iron-sulfur cluster-binding protein [Streptomyces]NEA03678.1 2Fe-2S iron-sulfur cluster binding domain-containing protein [Streptomyces sp. SID10116]MYY85299.1 2Fe-2S iron-sulfur cluster binding domain-containing protein [Streptomyces sp. SID335]MYZ13108.1 2Fe-2S iron-sulfur cluster binding domain-containing protein [Streptomyces sp. SID337]NDZ87537.1 2Fe-2S iron-sulfur cluster binding domain-containing protein [Streptomyces sp. SID10115]NEB46439.1 2Fe-2S iron-sulfur cl